MDTPRYVLRRSIAFRVSVWALPLFLIGFAFVAQAVVEAGVQVLTRGPVHEAFAEAAMSGAMAGSVVSKTPYDAIRELPPDQRPEGDNMAWIPGYWSWDDDRTDFVWVSGVWRNLPPGRQWVPGYWASVQGGSQWISGFWGDALQAEVTYLPPPPEPLEVGPSSPSPVPGNVWTPGCWVWRQTRYDWQPGYWVAQQPNWVWSPAHYTWTPRGYVYVPGYWDHDLVHRGVMFAPVYYEQPVYTRPNYVYSPRVVIDVAAILEFLFVQPRSHHYYFGDYYDSRYEQRGYQPWYSREGSRHGDDPIYAHYRARQLQRDRDWDVHVDEQYRYRREHVEARPAQTLALQVNIINTQKVGAPERVVIGKSLDEVVKSKSHPVRFRPVNMDERKQIEARGQEVHKLRVERSKIETSPAAAAEAAPAPTRPVQVQLPPSPVVARPTAKVKGMKTPPVPEEPVPRAIRGVPSLVTSPDGEMGKRPNESPDRPAQRETPRAHDTPTSIEPPKIHENATNIEPPKKHESPSKIAAPEPRAKAPAPAKEKSKTRSSSATQKKQPKSEAMDKTNNIPGTPPLEGAVEPKKSEPEQNSPRVRKSDQQADPNAQSPQTDVKQKKNKRNKAESGEEDEKNGGKK